LKKGKETWLGSNDLCCARGKSFDRGNRSTSLLKKVDKEKIEFSIHHGQHHREGQKGLTRRKNCTSDNGGALKVGVHHGASEMGAGRGLTDQVLWGGHL